MHLRIAFLDRFSAALRVRHTLRVEAGCHQGYGRMCLPLSTPRLRLHHQQRISAPLLIHPAHLLRRLTTCSCYPFKTRRCSRFPPPVSLT